MDTSNIPRIFWYSLSFCMVVTTIVLLVIAYNSSAISIEIANAKIELSSALSQTKEIKNDLKIENERLISANKALEVKLAHLMPPDNRSCPPFCGAPNGSGGPGGSGGTGGGSSKPGGGESSSAEPSVTIEYLREHGIIGGKNSEIRKLEISPEWFETLDSKIQSAEQVLK